MKPLQDDPIHVVKLGGSLLDLPDLIERLSALVGSCDGEQLLLIVGGGKAADLIRQYDQQFGLDRAAAHWLAIRAMQLNSIVVGHLLNQPLVCDPKQCISHWHEEKLAIVDPHCWLQTEEDQGIHIPHRWSFTSDSIAAHIATQIGASKLSLLKSAHPSETCDLGRVAAMGFVDGDFEAMSRSLDHVELIDLRTAPPYRCVLR